MVIIGAGWGVAIWWRVLRHAPGPPPAPWQKWFACLLLLPQGIFVGNALLTSLWGNEAFVITTGYMSAVGLIAGGIEAWRTTRLRRPAA